MANRNFQSMRIYNHHIAAVMIDCTIRIGTSGAVTGFTGSLVKSVTHASTGVYVITFQDPYMKMLASQGMMQSAPSTLSGIMAIEMQNNPNATVVQPTNDVTIHTLNSGGSNADPVTGSAINVMMILSNSKTTTPNE